MNILNYLPTHKMVELNISTGHRISHMLAQTPITKPGTGIIKDYIDNGVLFEMSYKDGTIAVADSTPTGQLFIHYTEELMNSIVSGFKYFTVDYGTDGKAYPRLIALYSGDTWTVDNFVVTTQSTGGAAIPANPNEYAFAIPKAGQFEVFKTLPTAYEGHFFTVVKSNLPDGTPAIQATFVK